MSTVYVFPGQGAQIVGMGADLYKNNAAARAVFDEVDDALDEKLSKIIFDGPMEELTLTKNVQPAIMATSVAMFRASGLPIPEYVAGHSLGEYTALCIAGAISLSDTAKLLRARGNAMQTSVPVGMGLTSVVLGLDANTVRNICNKCGCDMANDNCPGQVVISGTKESVESATEKLKEAGAKDSTEIILCFKNKYFSVTKKEWKNRIPWEEDIDGKSHGYDFVREEETPIGFVDGENDMFEYIIMNDYVEKSDQIKVILSGVCA